MTEQEMLENLDEIWTFGHEPTDKQREAVSMAMDAVEELQKYHAIGTVEECQEARKKQQAITPITNQHWYACPECGSTRSIKQKHSYCHECGQALDWGEVL